MTRILSAAVVLLVIAGCGGGVPVHVIQPAMGVPESQVLTSWPPAQRALYDQAKQLVTKNMLDFPDTPAEWLSPESTNVVDPVTMNSSRVVQGRVVALVKGGERKLLEWKCMEIAPAGNKPTGYFIRFDGKESITVYP